MRILHCLHNCYTFLYVRKLEYMPISGIQLPLSLLLYDSTHIRTLYIFKVGIWSLIRTNLWFCFSAFCLCLCVCLWLRYFDCDFQVIRWNCITEFGLDLNLKNPQSHDPIHFDKLNKTARQHCKSPNKKVCISGAYVCVCPDICFLFVFEQHVWMHSHGTC